MKPNEIKHLTEEAIEQSIEKFVVGVVVPNHNQVLLLQRLSNDTYPNMFEIPGGEVEDGETLSDAVKRELYEETGLEMLEIKRYIGRFDYESNSGKKVRQFNFLVSTKDQQVKWHPEHQKFAWISNEDIKSYEMTPEMFQTVSSLFENSIV